MTSAKEIARAFVDMVLSEDIEYRDVVEFADEYDGSDESVALSDPEEIFERVCEYMDELRIGFQNGK